MEVVGFRRDFRTVVVFWFQFDRSFWIIDHGAGHEQDPGAWPQPPGFGGMDKGSRQVGGHDAEERIRRVPADTLPLGRRWASLEGSN